MDSSLRAITLRWIAQSRDAVGHTAPSAYLIDRLDTAENDRQSTSYPQSRGEQDAGMLTKRREVRQGCSRPEGASYPSVTPLYLGKEFLKPSSVRTARRLN